MTDEPAPNDLPAPPEHVTPRPTQVPAWLPSRDPLGRPATVRLLRVQGEDTVRRLLDAGREAFARNGYAATRVDDVVHRAGTSHGTFYLYFRNKEDLLHRLAIECGHQLDGLTAQFGALPEPIPFDDLVDWVTSLTRLYRDYGSVFRAWIERRDVDPLMQALANDKLGALAEHIQRRLDPEVAERVGSGVATLAVISLLERMSAYLEANEHALDEARVARMSAQMFHALLAR